MIKKIKIKSSETTFALLVSLPMILYIVCILLIPVLWGVSLSFTDKAIGGSAHFIALNNYIKLLSDKQFMKSVINTVVYTFFSISGKMIFGLIMALALNMKFRGRNIARALMIIPWTLPNIVSVLNWKWIFSDTGGVANFILKNLGIIDKDLVWMGTATLAMISVLVVNIWRGTPFFGISILSKLQTIPEDYYEAAEIDGANTLQKFIHVTLPEISSVIMITALVSTIWTINEFESVWLLTGGGPSGSTELISIFSYRTAMTSMQLGQGVAVSVLVMPVLIVLINLVSKKMLGNEKNS